MSGALTVDPAPSVHLAPLHLGAFALNPGSDWIHNKIVVDLAEGFEKS
jgi:hypothetical protein